MRASHRPVAPLVAAVLAAAVATGALAGCTESRTPAPPQPEPAVITRDQAEDLFAELSETRNTANAAQDPAMLADIETGSVLRSSTFAYATQKAQATGAVPPYDSVPGTLAAPADANGADADAAGSQWFYSLGAPGADLTSPTGSTEPTGSTTEPPDAYLESTYFVREDASSPWLMSLQLPSDPNTLLPQPILAAGHAVLPDDAAQAAGKTALADVVTFARTGEAPDTLDTTDADQLATAHEQGYPLTNLSADAGTQERSCAVEGDVAAWVEAVEGIFTMGSVECTQRVTLATGWQAPTPTDVAIGTVPAGKHLSAWTVTQTVTFLLTVHDDGTANVIGSRLRPVATEATIVP